VASSSSPSSQISHLISFGFIFAAEEPEAEVTSTEDANRFTGKDEAEAETVEVEVAACLPFLPRRFSTATGITAGTIVGISKTARHTGHLKGALPISSISIQENELLIAITSES